jgi:hypothetical protein
MESIKIFFDKYSDNDFLNYKNFKALLLLIFNSHYQNIIKKVNIKEHYSYDEVISIIIPLLVETPCIVKVEDIKKELNKDFIHADVLFIISKVYGDVSNDDYVDAGKLNTFYKSYS